MVAVAVSPDGRDVAYARAHSVAVLDSKGQQVASLSVAGGLRQASRSALGLMTCW